MMLRPTVSLSAGALILAFGACARPPSPGAALDAAGPPVVNDARWHGQVQALVDGFQCWGSLDDAMRWAPLRCWIPAVHARASAAPSSSPHGRKLYSLWALDAAAYGAEPTDPRYEADLSLQADFEQALVKQAFRPVAVPPEAPPHTFADGLGHAESDGRLFAPGEDAGLFLMFRPRQAVAPTDAGWVYASVLPDGTITGAGPMASCMDCHTREEDRLFGLPER